MHSKPLRIILLLAVIAGLSACGRKETQKSLARRFSEADRAIASYDMGGGFKASMPLTTQETKKLIKALSKGERIYGSVEATPNMPIEFYKGTNLLGMLRTGSGKVFWTAHATYVEATGVLESFFWRVRAQADQGTPELRPNLPEFSTIKTNPTKPWTREELEGLLPANPSQAPTNQIKKGSDLPPRYDYE